MPEDNLANNKHVKIAAIMGLVTYELIRRQVDAEWSALVGCEDEPLLLATCIRHTLSSGELHHSVTYNIHPADYDRAHIGARVHAAAIIHIVNKVLIDLNEGWHKKHRKNLGLVLMPVIYND